jgi:hypothetical protein
VESPVPRGSPTRGRTPLDSDAAGPQVTLIVVEDERDLLPSTMAQSTSTVRSRQELALIEMPGHDLVDAGPNPRRRTGTADRQLRRLVHLDGADPGREPSVFQISWKATPASGIARSPRGSVRDDDGARSSCDR